MGGIPEEVPIFLDDLRDNLRQILHPKGAVRQETTAGA